MEYGGVPGGNGPSVADSAATEAAGEYALSSSSSSSSLSLPAAVSAASSLPSSSPRRIRTKCNHHHPHHLSLLVRKMAKTVVAAGAAFLILMGGKDGFDIGGGGMKIGLGTGMAKASAFGFGGGGMLPPSTSPPVMGIGALLFRPKGVSIRPSLGKEEDLVEAGMFFTDAFWSGKVGGASELTSYQRSSIERQQVMEFRRRYGSKSALSLSSSSSSSSSSMSPNNSDRRAELLICRDEKGTLLGCAGIEVDTISKTNDPRGGQGTKRRVVGKTNYGTTMSGRVRAPLMSNLAVGKSYRRRGIAEDLVTKAEQLARKEWGYDECYLYVEKRNVAAVRLYKKLGYRLVWEDDKAKTLVPTEGGTLRTANTVILCMKKRLGGGLIGRLLPF